MEDAAAAAMVVASENIVGAIRELTIAQGIDPRELAIVAGGGASGLNIVPIARELGCRRVLLPSTAAVLSATGALHSDVISEFSRSVFAETGAFDFEKVNGTLATIDEAATRYNRELDDLRPVEARKEFFVEARYRGQVWELEVPLREARFRSDSDVEALEDDFHETHERVFAVREPGQHLECLLWKVRTTAALTKPRLRPRTLQAAAAGPSDHRRAYFRETGAIDVSVFDGDALAALQRIEGPAIIREPTTTVVVYPGSVATVTALGNYLLEIVPASDYGSGVAAGATEEVPV
jgi:N-methylhydantoinase A